MLDEYSTKTLQGKKKTFLEQYINKTFERKYTLPKLCAGSLLDGCTLMCSSSWAWCCLSRFWCCFWNSEMSSCFWICCCLWIRSSSRCNCFSQSSDSRSQSNMLTSDVPDADNPSESERENTLSKHFQTRFNAIKPHLRLDNYLAFPVTYLALVWFILAKWFVHKCSLNASVLQISNLFLRLAHMWRIAVLAAWKWQIKTLL